MTYTKTTWLAGDDITAAKLNNMEGQYDAAKADFGPVTTTVTIGKENESLHALGADYTVSAGSTSAEDTINTAINAIVTYGGEIMLLEGTYTIDGPIQLKDGITLSGMGPNTIIKLKDGFNSNISMVTHYTQAAPGNKNMTIKDLTINGNEANQTSGTTNGIYFVNCTDTTTRIIVRNCYLLDFRSGVGVYVDTSKSVIVDKCVVKGADVAGVYGSTSTFSVVNNTINNSTDGIYLSGCSDCVVANNDIFSNTSDGLHFVSTTVRTAVTGCTLYNNGESGLRINGSTYNNVVGNVFRNNTGAGALIESASNYTTLVGNSFYLNQINVKVDTSHYCLMAGNTCSYATQHGIYFNAANWACVSSNVVYMNGYHGIYLYNNSRCNLENNNVSANSQGATASYQNIMLDTSSSNSVTGNLCHRGGGPIYPQYGIRIASGSYNLVTANYLKDGGSAGAISDSGTSTDKTAWMAAGNKTS